MRGTGTMKFVTEAARAVGTLKFHWEFWKQSCANLPAEVLFGQIRIFSPTVELSNVPGSVSVRLQVRTGLRSVDHWEVKRKLSSTGVTTWQTKEHWWSIWHFGTTPLVAILVERSSLSVAPAAPPGSQGVAFYCLPHDAR